MKKFIKSTCIFLSLLCFSLLGAIGYARTTITDNYLASDFNLNKTELPIDYEILSVAKETVFRTDQKEDFNVVFKLFGVFPIKDASINIEKRSYVNVLGKPFGIKLYTDGVLVVNLSPFETAEGNICPAAIAGLKSGDYIISIDEVNVFSNSQLGNIIEAAGGKSMEVIYSRNDKVYKTKVSPMLSNEDEKYHLGMWVRDSSAGVGTLTFFDPESNILAGLGHPLCDSDTGEMISVNKGSIVEAEILSIAKSEAGRAGELLGRFKPNEYSKAITNSPNGIYVKCEKAIGDSSIPIAYSFEIEEGNAELITTVSGEEPQKYACMVEKIYDKEGNKNFLIKVTDEALISKAGGIVQGMSGSPLIQNGKLIGAVTHVLVDDPTKGYAIFAENMLTTAKSVAQEYLKEAS